MFKEAAQPLSTEISTPEVSVSISLSIVTLIQIRAQHNLHQSGGKLLTFDFCTPKSSEDDKEFEIRNRPNSFSVRSFLFFENIFLNIFSPFSWLIEFLKYPSSYKNIFTFVNVFYFSRIRKFKK